MKDIALSIGIQSKKVVNVRSQLSFGSHNWQSLELQAFIGSFREAAAQTARLKKLQLQPIEQVISS